MEPPHSYVRNAPDSVVHHEDYLDGRPDHALCGAAFDGPTRLGTEAQPVAVCPACETKLVEYHLKWWRDTALAAIAENDELRVKYRELAGDGGVRSAAPAAAESRPHAQPRRAAPAAGADSPPQSPLDHARQQLRELCQQFDDAVPYRQLKNTMQAFSDRLNPDDRTLLAQQIGNDGSLLRWSTTEVQKLGWSVSDNPLPATPEEIMWEDWTQSHQTPKPSRWRLTRSRSRDG
ncbi:hypothetical protein [Mycolicibacterium pulveris]|uniref:hypothetical protein n=1 Tax=Mycolicibacterium pulveris TaxID=36813 RepID=UPI003CF5AAE9